MAPVRWIHMGQISGHRPSFRRSRSLFIREAVRTPIPISGGRRAPRIRGRALARYPRAMGQGREEITRVLKAAAAGGRQAAQALLPLVYQDLKALARARLRRLRKGETITTPDLVHDSWLRLVAAGAPGWESRRHF